MATSTTKNWPYVINLGNSIIGVSVLAMPFCFKQCGMVLGMILLLSSAWLTNLSCQLLMRAATTSKKRSYEFLALHTLGYMGKLAVELCMIGLLLGTCVAFFVVIGDLGPAIISKLLGLENSSALRTGLMMFLAMFVAMPLGMLRNIDSLSNISAVSIGFYTVFVAEVFTLAFTNLWSGIWVTKVEFWNPEGVFRCLPIFALAFGCQSQLFVMYDALPEPSMKVMNSIVTNAVSLCTAVYLCVGFFGYIAFCEEDVQGDVLMNFKPTIFSEAIKLGFVLSVAMSFPLVIFPCRASIYTLLFAKLPGGGHENIGGAHMIPEFHFKLITVCLVCCTLVMGIMVPNVEYILGLTGATMGSMICYVFPAIIFISVMSLSKHTSKSSAQVVLFLGVTILLASTYVTIYGQDSTEDKPQSVVKIADNLVPKAVNAEVELPVKDTGGGGKKNVAKDGKAPNVAAIKLPAAVDKVHKDTVKVLPKKDAEMKDGMRQEPPIPHAPDDTVEKNKKAEEAGDGKAVVNIGPADPKGDEKDKAVADKEKEKPAEETKHLIKELKEQQKEQKKLIQEQKELIQELKQHKLEAHADTADKIQPTGQVLLQQPVQQQGGQQQQMNQQPLHQQPAQGQVQQPVQGQVQQPVQGQVQQPVQGQVQQPVQGQVQQPVQGQVQQPVQGQVQQPVQGQVQQPVQGQVQQPVQGQARPAQAVNPGQQQVNQPVGHQQEVHQQQNNANNMAAGAKQVQQNVVQQPSVIQQAKKAVNPMRRLLAALV